MKQLAAEWFGQQQSWLVKLGQKVKRSSTLNARYTPWSLKKGTNLSLIQHTQTLVSSKNINPPNQIAIKMKSTPEIINISSDSSSDDETPLPPYVPPFRPPHGGCRTKEQARKRKHDLPVFKDLLNLNQTPSSSRGKGVMPPKSPYLSESSVDPNP